MQHANPHGYLELKIGRGEPRSYHGEEAGVDAGGKFGETIRIGAGKRSVGDRVIARRNDPGARPR